MDFSIAECMQKMHIQNGSHLEKMQSFYCCLDDFILAEQPYLENCMFLKSCEQTKKLEVDILNGILLRSVKMGMESELGGAIKKEHARCDRILSRMKLTHQTTTVCISWASCPESVFVFKLNLLSSEDKMNAYSALNAGKGYRSYIQGRQHRNCVDDKRQFDLECNLMNLDAVALPAQHSYRQGVIMNLELADLHDGMLDTLVGEWQSYQRMTPQERTADFNRFIHEIRCVNGLEPKKILSHNDDNNLNNNNINQRR